MDQAVAIKKMGSRYKQMGSIQSREISNEESFNLI